MHRFKLKIVGETRKEKKPPKLTFCVRLYDRKKKFEYNLFQFLNLLLHDTKKICNAKKSSMIKKKLNKFQIKTLRITLY